LLYTLIWLFIILICWAGKVYILNVNNLGGFKLGVGQTDGIIQTIVTNEAVFGAAGSYPLEGGFIYLTPVGYPTYAYSLGFTSTGTPQFSQVAATNETSTGRVGVGIPTITTLNVGTIFQCRLLFQCFPIISSAG
jgi:hypothetical protein